MASYKEIWIEEYDRIYNDALDAGCSEADAVRRADRLTDNAAKDRFADMVDFWRDKAKEEG